MPDRSLKKTWAGNWAVIILLGLYFTAVVLMVVAGRYALIVKTVVIPMVFLLALMRHQGKQFIKDWLLFLCLVFLFDYLRGLIFAIVIRYQLPVYMQYAIRAEQVLGGGVTYPEMLQNLRMSLGEPLWLDRFFILIHGSHFFVFLLVGFMVWIHRKEAFLKYQLAMLGVMYFGLWGYLTVPTVPPWMAAEDYHALPTITRIGYSIYNMTLPQLFRVFDKNPIAAMPSLHCAFPMMCGLVMFRHFRFRGFIIYIYTLLVFFAVIYLGEHYLVDVVAGICLSILIYYLVYYKIKWESVKKWLSGFYLRNIHLPDTWRRVVVPVVLTGLLCFATGKTTQRILPWSPNWDNFEFYSRELKGRVPDSVGYLVGHARFISPFRLELVVIDDLWRIGNRDAAMEKLESLKVRFPNDPELMFWKNYYSGTEGESGQFMSAHEHKVFRNSLPEKQAMIYCEILCSM